MEYVLTLKTLKNYPFNCWKLFIDKKDPCLRIGMNFMQRVLQSLNVTYFVLHPVEVDQVCIFRYCLQYVSNILKKLNDEGRRNLKSRFCSKFKFS